MEMACVSILAAVAVVTGKERAEKLKEEQITTEMKATKKRRRHRRQTLYEEE
jgi:hypothetical protein